MADLITVQNVRDFTNVGSEEYDDQAIGLLISGAQADIKSRTGRIWGSIATESNELYTGDGGQKLYLNQGDIISVTSLSIDDDDDDTFTTITVTGSDPSIKISKDEGIVELKTDAEVTAFPTWTNSTKITYTYSAASSSTPSDVKLLALWLVRDQLFPTEPIYTWQIRDKYKQLKRIGATLA